MHDALPEQVCAWRLIESRASELLNGYGYREIRLPILEKAELFRRSIGDVTDIVEKEMYTFKDVGEDLLSLRPEGTASCVRACLQHGLIGKGRRERLWYSGPFFRRERPQKGRYRQFYQIGAEAFGFERPDIDAELIILLDSLITHRLPVIGDFSIEINTLGNAKSRVRYRAVLTDYLKRYEKEMDENARKRILTNPLRVLDSKDEKTQKIVCDAPKIEDFLDDPSRKHFDRLQTLLQKAGVVYRVNPHLVRGLDYYTHTVFELVLSGVTDGGYALCAGGRYDNLVEQLGGMSVPAVGFAIGADRLALHLGRQNPLPQSADIYVVAVGREAEDYAQSFIAKLRKNMFLNEQSNLKFIRDQRQKDLNRRDIYPQPKREPRIVVNIGGEKISSQLKKANKSGASIALIFGDEEMASRTVTVKFMRSSCDQECIPAADICEQLSAWQSKGLW